MAKKIATKDGRDVYGFDFSDISVKAIGENEIEIIGSTSAQDRDGEVIDPKGWDLKNYKKNPVILPAHDYSQPAIGRATKVKLEDGKLKFKIEFPPEGDNPVADIYRKLYKGGFMNASSVGFIPTEWKDGDGKKEPYRRYLKQELLELSLVSVPSNPTALVSAKGIQDAKEKGVISEDEIETLKNFYPEDQHIDEAEEKATPEINKEMIDAEIARQIKVYFHENREAIKEAIFELMTEDCGEFIKDVMSVLIKEDHYRKMLFGDLDQKDQTDSKEKNPIESERVSTDKLINSIKDGFK